MKRYLLIFSALLFTSNIFAQTLAGDTCITIGGSGNIVVFANYDGGVLNINVDQNIPNLKIGICTYEPVTINLSGPFVNNITEVRYAGYVSTANNHCFNSPGTTTIVGAPGGATTSVNFLPPATLMNPNGYGSIVCGYTCDINTNQGGCNTADQIQDYFETSMGGTLYSYFTQYGCWSVVPYNVSAGGNCPFSSTPDTTVTIFSSTSSTICVGETVNFTDLSPGASSWTWTATGSSIPTSNSQNLTGVTWSSTGTYSVSLSTNDGTGICSASQTITVIPNPTINAMASDNPICNGDTTTLSALGGISYTWSPSGPGIVTPSGSMWYYVDGIGANGCSGSDSVFIVVIPNPAAPTIIYSGGTLNASPVATSYQWYLNGNPIAGANSSSYVPTQNGIYTVELTDGNGCTSALSLPTIVSDLALEDIELGVLEIFPNPGSGIFQIKLPSTFNTQMLVEVIDMVGKTIYSKTVHMTDIYSIDLTTQATGIYEVQIKNAKNIFRGKLIIQ